MWRMSFVSISILFCVLFCREAFADRVQNNRKENAVPDEVFELNRRLMKMEALRAEDTILIGQLMTRIVKLENLYFSNEFAMTRKLTELEKQHTFKIAKISKDMENLIKLHDREINELSETLAKTRNAHEADKLKLCKNEERTGKDMNIFNTTDTDVHSSNLTHDTNALSAAAGEEEKTGSAFELQRSFPKFSRRLVKIPEIGFEDNVIAFSVALRDVISDPGSGQTVIFDNVLTNVSATYSPSSGIFHCNHRGVYVFFWTIEVANSHFISTELVRNGVVIGEITVTGSTDWRLASNLLSVVLNFGDEVWVRIDGHSPGADIQKSGTSFTGFLLH